MRRPPRHPSHFILSKNVKDEQLRVEFSLLVGVVFDSQVGPENPRKALPNRRETRTVTVQELIACRRQQAAVSTSQFLFGESGAMQRLREDVAAASRSRRQRAHRRRSRSRQTDHRAAHSRAGRRRPHPSSRSTAPACPSRCSNRSCSVMRAAASPARTATNRVWRRKATAARSSSTRLATCLAACRRYFLRFVETGARRGGRLEPREQRANVRIIAAAGHGLAQPIASGDFREDLYYRLNVIRLTIPPLRERGARHHGAAARIISSERARAHGVDTPRLSAGAIVFSRRITGPGTCASSQTLWNAS